MIFAKGGSVSVAARPANPWDAYRVAPSASYAGQTVTPETATGLAAVYGAVSMVSSTCSTMPLEIVDTRAQSGRRKVENSWLSTMLRYSPNSDMSGVDLWFYVFASLMLRGNAYLAKIKDAQGRVSELYPLLTECVTPFRDDNGNKVFRVQVLNGSTVVEAVYTPDVILHIKGPSMFDPLVGEAPVSMIRNRIGAQLAQSEYQARAYQDGMLVKGALSTAERNLTPESVARLKAHWRSAYSGVTNAHEIAVLHSGLQFQQISLSPSDAQFIETMRWGHTEIATMYGIPASRLNGESATGTYQNQAQDDLFYYQQACRPRVEIVEASLNRDADLFGAYSAWVPRFNESSVLRADIKTRFETYRIARDIGVLSANEIREAEDYPNIGPDGDDYTPLANRSLGRQQATGEARSNDLASLRDVNVHVSQPEQRELPAPIVNVAAPDVMMPEVRVEAPIVNVEPTEVRVEAQPAPIVNVNVPEQPAPVVNVDAPIVNVAAPEVRVEPQIIVEQPTTNKKLRITRDANGYVSGATVEEQ